MFSLPTAITIHDKSYKIRNNGDYRMVIDCFKALNDEELDDTLRVLSARVIFYKDCKSLKSPVDLFGEYITDAISEMYNFFNCGQKSVGSVQPHKLMDWEEDSQLICAAVNNVAGKEVRSLEYLHWWTFMGYYLSLGESAFTTVVSIRDKIIKHKTLDKWEKEFKQNNPEYFIIDIRTNEEKDFENELRKLWDSQ